MGRFLFADAADFAFPILPPERSLSTWTPVAGKFSAAVAACHSSAARSMAEMDPEAAEVFGVLFDAVIEGLDVLLLEEFEHAFF